MAIFLVALFVALLILVLMVDRAAMSRRAKTTVEVALTLAAITVAFQVGFWQGLVLLLASVTAAELWRLVRRRARAAT